MALFGRKKPEAELKAFELSPSLQAILDRGPIPWSGTGVGFFQAFGTSYAELYRRNPALRSVVDFLSRNIAQCRAKVYSREPDGSSLPAPTHPVQELLDHPAPGTSRGRFFRQIVADKALYDTAAVWKIRETFRIRPDGTALNQGTVRALLRIPVPYVSILQGSLVAPVLFSFALGRDAVEAPASDVVWLPGYSPTSNTQGVPPAETLRQVLAEEWAAGQNRENFWRKGPQVNSWFYHPPDVPDLSEEQLARFRERWNERYGGVNASDAGGTPKLPPGIELRDLVIDAQQQEYLSTRTFAREEVCRAFGIQPQLLGITQANFASMDAYHQMLYQDTLAPWMVPIQEEFEEQLLAEFEDLDDYFIDFNINAKLEGSFLEQAKIGQQAVGGPWMTRNEFREKFQGLPPIPGGDDIVIPLNVALGGGPQANPADAQNQFQGKSEQLRLIGGDGP